VVKSRGQHCGDIELGGYLSNAAGPVSSVLDLRVAHDRVGSSADPALNGHLRYPNNLDQLHSEFYSYRLIGKLTAFLQLQEFCQRNQIVDSSTTAARRFLLCSKSRVGNILAKAAALRINLNIDGAPIASKSHTHPSHSQTSRLLTSSMSLGVPVPRPTQCLRGV
jgi:hypothetical protein